MTQTFAIDVDRPLTAAEYSLVRWLLEHGAGNNAEFIKQLDQARVVQLCSCGCASIDFSIRGKRPTQCALQVLSDYQWRTDQDHLCGAFVFEQDGFLAGLELWSIDGQSSAGTLPCIESLVPLVE